MIIKYASYFLVNTKENKTPNSLVHFLSEYCDKNTMVSLSILDITSSFEGRTDGIAKALEYKDGDSVLQVIINMDEEFSQVEYTEYSQAIFEQDLHPFMFGCGYKCYGVSVTSEFKLCESEGMGKGEFSIRLNSFALVIPSILICVFKYEPSEVSSVIEELASKGTVLLKNRVPTNKVKAVEKLLLNEKLEYSVELD